MIVANHPRAAAAGADILASGGNAADAAVATLFALCVVEPMMVGIAGGGLTHVRAPDGTHVVFDALSCAGAAMRPDLYEPEGPDSMDVRGALNRLGPSSVAVPGNLAGWCAVHARFGRLPFEDVVAPAIALAELGFAATPYLSGAVLDAQSDLARDPVLARLFLPDGAPIVAGARVVQGEAADSLRLIASEGAHVLYGGALGTALIDALAKGDAPGRLMLDDLQRYRVIERAPVIGTYRGYEIVGPPPPASSGVHIVQMLNMLSFMDPAPFGSAEQAARLVEVMRAAFADRRRYSGDPAFVDVPVERLISLDHARACMARVPDRPMPYESADTTHVTVADADGMVVCATHTINGLFGARFAVPGTGIIPNNYMCNFDPNPGRALSIQPGKRVPTSMAPMMVRQDGRMAWALGLPGGTRIFPSALQAIVNLIDHGMDLQEAIEAPRLWTDGGPVELERGLATLADGLAASGNVPRIVPHIGGGMNAIGFGADGSLIGAACWRADGTAIGIGGGPARPGVRFWPGQVPVEGQK